MNVYYKVLNVSIVLNRKLQWFILFNLQNGYIQTDDFEISIDHMGHSETEKVTEVIQHHVKTCTIPAGNLNNMLYNQNQIQVNVINISKFMYCKLVTEAMVKDFAMTEINDILAYLCCL